MSQGIDSEEEQFGCVDCNLQNTEYISYMINLNLHQISNCCLIRFNEINGNLKVLPISPNWGTFKWVKEMIM